MTSSQTVQHHAAAWCKRVALFLSEVKTVEGHASNKVDEYDDEQPGKELENTIHQRVFAAKTCNEGHDHNRTNDGQVIGIDAGIKKESLNNESGNKNKSQYEQ